MPIALTRYLAALVLGRSLGALGLLVLLYVSVDAVEVAAAPDVSGWSLLCAYAFKLPTIVSQVLPMALALGVLMAFSRMRRIGEWEAVQLAGVSPLSIAAALLLVPAFGAALANANARCLAPTAMAHHERLLSDGASFSSARLAVRWSRDGDRLVRAGSSDGAVLSIERGRDGRAREWSRRGGDAARLAWRAGEGWRAGEEASLSPGAIRSFGALEVSSRALPGQSVRSDALAVEVERVESAGHDASALRAQIALRFTLGAACLLVPALGLAIAMLFDARRRSTVVLVGLCASAFYWFAVVVAWNGALCGAWPASVIGAGVPLLGLVAVSLAGVAAGRRLR